MIKRKERQPGSYWLPLKKQDVPLPEKPWYKSTMALIAAATAGIALVAGAIGLYKSIAIPEIPETAVQFVIDASDEVNSNLHGISGKDAISQSLAAALGAVSSEDFLSIRVFGGPCVSSGSRNVSTFEQHRKDALLTKWGSVRPAGSRPLVLGIIESVGDFSKPPIRLAKHKRIVIVTTGEDQCGHLYGTPETAYQLIGNRLKESGIRAEFFVIGYGVPLDRQARILQLAASLGGNASFPDGEAELTESVGQALSGKQVQAAKPKGTQYGASQSAAVASNQPAVASSQPEAPIAAAPQPRDPTQQAAGGQPTDSRTEELIRVAKLGPKTPQQISYLFQSLERLRFAGLSTAAIPPAMLLRMALRELESNDGLELFILQKRLPADSAGLLILIRDFYDAQGISITQPEARTILARITENQAKYYRSEFVRGIFIGKYSVEQYVDVLREQVAILDLAQLLVSYSSTAELNLMYLTRGDRFERRLTSPYRSVLASWCIASIQRNSGQLPRLAAEVSSVSESDLLRIFLGAAAQGDPRGAFEAAEILGKTKPVRDPEVYQLYRRAAQARIPTAQDRLLAAGLDPYN